MNGISTSRPDPITWVMDAWLAKIPSATAALLVTTDGLVRSHSATVTKDTADPAAAALSGMLACAAGVGDLLGAGTVQVAVLEMTSGWVFVTMAAPGTLLGVVADGQARPDQVSHQMQDLVAQLGEHLKTAARHPAKASLGST